MREELAARHIHGSGLELCPRHCPLKVQGTKVTVIDVDQAQFPDLVLDVETLHGIDHESQDFVIANHVFEHCERAIFSLESWLRKLKPGGILFLAIPDKAFTFDKKRESTTIKHLFEEYTRGLAYCAHVTRRAHHWDWFANSELEGITDPALIEKRVKESLDSNANIHWHVWTHYDMCRLFNWLVEILPMRIVESARNGAESLWVFERTAL